MIDIADSDFINAGDFSFAPFHPGVGGDSGTLRLATSKQNPDLQYVVKMGEPQLAANEFMYHKLAAALGLYTQEVKLFRGNARYRHACAIRYVNGAQPYHSSAGGSDHIRALIAFRALYIILNEDDSFERYLDGAGRLFKLDNASSFNLDAQAVNGILHGARYENLERRLHFCEYPKYRILRNILTRDFGLESDSVYLGTIRRFAELDDSCMDDPCGAIEQNYPEDLGDYYFEFFLIRQKVCHQFLQEIGKEL